MAQGQPNAWKHQPANAPSRRANNYAKSTSTDRGASTFISQQDSASKHEITKKADEIDRKMGFDRYEAGPAKTGWLINMHSTTVPDDDVLEGTSGVDYYFLDEEGGYFKATVKYDPYFLITCRVRL